MERNSIINFYIQIGKGYGLKDEELKKFIIKKVSKIIKIDDKILKQIQYQIENEK